MSGIPAVMTRSDSGLKLLDRFLTEQLHWLQLHASAWIVDTSMNVRVPDSASYRREDPQIPALRCRRFLILFGTAVANLLCLCCSTQSARRSRELAPRLPATR